GAGRARRRIGPGGCGVPVTETTHDGARWRDRHPFPSARPARPRPEDTMKRKPIIAAAVALVVVATLLYFYRRADASDTAAYRTAVIERGDISATVSATGALSAVTTVQVVTQVSGQ